MGARFTVNYEIEDWKVGASRMFDVHGRSKVSTAKANVVRVFRKELLFFEPSLSLRHLDSNYVDYYYGVKPVGRYISKRGLDNYLIKMSVNC